jgi:hypothetical protein
MRDFEDGEELSQRDTLERRALGRYHKWKANRASMKAQKYQAKADRHSKAASGQLTQSSES